MTCNQSVIDRLRRHLSLEKSASPQRQTANQLLGGSGNARLSANSSHERPVEDSPRKSGQFCPSVEDAPANYVWDLTGNWLQMVGCAYVHAIDLVKRMSITRVISLWPNLKRSGSAQKNLNPEELRLTSASPDAEAEKQILGRTKFLLLALSLTITMVLLVQATIITVMRIIWKRHHRRFIKTMNELRKKGSKSFSPPEGKRSMERSVVKSAEANPQIPQPVFQGPLLRDLFPEDLAVDSADLYEM
ncbi:unnamed protein product [Cylicocyclus nassatus]|uniref:Uncharacterized protein n=1 Tax=Cylicocyclus nassatus TaxID=53992 RepID=A0AA36GGZ9_CYLNA|nr:unnamed protein product [Cylicocyclus nassatus]